MKAYREGDSIVLMQLLSASALAYAVREHLTTPYDALFEAAATEYDVPANMLRAIARVESNFRADAVSPPNTNGTRDYGLMQLNTNTAARYGYSDPSQLLDPSKNVRLAARILSDMRGSLKTLKRFSPITWAIAYNVGPDLSPWEVGAQYGSRVTWHWTLYDLGRVFA